MGKIISVANQKGGVGKTTTTVNLSTILAKKGKKVLLIDADPQGNATSGLGIEKEVEFSTYDILVNDTEMEQALQKTVIKNLLLCPSNMNLAGAEVELVSMMSREQRLKEKLEEIKDNFDYIFIDCPPSLGLITLNAFTASDSVLIPVQCEYFALEGLGQLLNTVNLVKKHLNKTIMIEGALLTMYDIRTNLSNQVVKEVKKYFNDKVYKTVIPRNVRLSEAPSYGMPITEYDPRSKGAKAYMKFAKEFLKMNEEEKKAGLGKGLDALFGPAPEEEQMQENDILKNLKVTEVEPNRDQPRKNFDQEALEELAESIKEYGLIQPIVVTKKDGYYGIVAGERRWRASKIAGLTEIPAIIREDNERINSEISLIENMQREDLNPYEKALGVRTLIDNYGLSQEEVAKKLGKGRSTIANIVRILNLEPRVLEMAKEGKLTEGHCKALLAITDPEKQYKTAIQMLERGATVRQVEKKARVKETKEELDRNHILYKSIEDNFQSFFGSKVRLDAGKRRGKIIIEYTSNDDLERILNLIK